MMNNSISAVPSVNYHENNDLSTSQIKQQYKQ